MNQILYGFLYLISLLPWFIIYGMSDFFTFLVFNVFKYRRDVVMTNLGIAFPEKTLAEREKIAKDFYRLLMDTLMETIKLISLSREEVMKMFTGNAEVINQLADKGRNVQIMAMHNFNWEIVNLNMAIQFRYPFIGVYMPIKNTFFEKLLVKMRRRFGTILIRATHFKEDFARYNDTHHIMALVADQNPGNPDYAYWFRFFGKMTPFVKGAERGARIHGSAIVFGHFFPVRRGQYTFTCKVVCDNVNDLPEGELMRQYAEYVEESIRKHPANYLWSHRRWKHARENAPV